MVARSAASLPALAYVPPANPVRSDRAWQQVRAVFGVEGTLAGGGVLRITLPRSDFQTTVYGVPLSPSFVTATELSFFQIGDGSALAKYRLVLLDTEVSPVLGDIISLGTGTRAAPFTALLDYLLDVQPQVKYLHGSLRGDPDQLARRLLGVLRRTATPMGSSSGATAAAGHELGVGQIEQTIGAPGTVADGVLTIRIPRAETVVENSVLLPAAMQHESTFVFQACGAAQVAARGEYALLPEEAGHVAASLQSAGISVTALHNHELGTRPAVCYLHAWATGTSPELARGFRAALEHTNSRFDAR
jgi:hypothetical protein